MLKLLPVFLKYRNADTHRPHLAPGADDIDLQDFFAKHVNQELLDYYIEPTLATYCSWEPSDISLKMFGILMAGYLNQKLYTIKGGVGRLPAAFADQLHVELNTRVTRVVLRGGGAIVHATRDGADRRFDADVVVMAAPGDTVLSMLDDAPDDWRAFYSQVSYSSAVVIFRVVRLGDTPLPDNLTMSRAEGKLTSFVWFVDRRDDTALTLSELKPHLRAIHWSDADLLNRSRAEFVHFYPQLRDRIEGERLFRWPQKVPNFRVGYLDALREFRTRSPVGAIYPCGDYLAGPSTGAALSTGWQCADAITQA